MAYVATQHVHIPVTDFLQLEFHLIDTRPGVSPDAFVTDLVKRWLALDMERLSLRNKGKAIRGYQWKNVFLPDGTSLRTSHCGAVDFAKVIGNEIASDDGTSLTPSLFANRHAKGRNAWRLVWLRFPGDEYWVRADNCRTGSEAFLKQSKTKLPLYENDLKGDDV